MGRGDAVMTVQRADSELPRSFATPLLVAVVLIGTILRLAKLNSQLWIDEISALTGSIERPFSEIATRWPGSASHILYELLARAGFLSLGGPVGLRLPAAILGIVGVFLIWLYARRAFGQRSALVISGLTAVSYHHVFFSQNARGYTLLIALFLGTLVILAEAQRRDLVGGGLHVLYAVTGALAAYSMPTGWFILPGQALVVIGYWIWGRVAGRRPPLPVSLVASAAGGGALAALLYAPFVPAMLRFTRMNVATPEEGQRLGFGLVREVLDGLLAAFHGPVGLTIVAVFGLAGLVAWWRRHPVSLLAAFAPLVLEAVVIIAVGVGVHPRYFAVALPVLLVVAGLGLESIVAGVVSRAPITPRVQPRLVAGALAIFVLLSAWPLVRYYQYPKQDFLGAIATVEAQRPRCGVRVGIDVAGHVLADYYHAGFVTAENLGELRALEARAGTNPVCVVTTLEVLLGISDPDIVDHLRREYRRIAWLPGTVGDAAMRVYERQQP